NRATTALRPGATSSISGLMPSFWRTPATYRAASCSFPGGLEVLILIKSASQPCASLAIAEVLLSGDAGGGPAGIPGAACGIPCAATGKLAANSAAAVLM